MAKYHVLHVPEALWELIVTASGDIAGSTSTGLAREYLRTGVYGGVRTTQKPAKTQPKEKIKIKKQEVEEEIDYYKRRRLFIRLLGKGQGYQWIEPGSVEIPFFYNLVRKLELRYPEVSGLHASVSFPQTYEPTEEEMVDIRIAARAIDDYRELMIKEVAEERCLIKPGEAVWTKVPGQPKDAMTLAEISEMRQKQKEAAEYE